MLVVFEGLDCSGKSTLIKEISQHLPGCIQTKEPGSPHVAANPLLRELVLNNPKLSPLQREMLFYADALGHREFIKKLPKSSIVLSDRGILSHYAYVYGYMKLGLLGSDPDENYTRFGLCKQLIKSVCPEPDAVVYIRGSLEIMEERARRKKDAIESLGVSYFRNVLNSYEDQVIGLEIEDKPVLILDAKSSVGENAAKTLVWLSDLRKS